MFGVIAVCAMLIFYGFYAYTKTGTIVPTLELFDDKPTFRFIDVGQGNSTLITYRGDAVLIDAGTPGNKYETADYIRMFAPEIDYMIITHPHDDHMGGAAEIISQVEVKNLIIRDVEVSDSFYTDALDAAEKCGTNITILSSAAEFITDNITVEILDSFDFEFSDLNDSSMVTRVTAGKTSALITGDAGEKVEQILVAAYGEDLHANILEVGHHGSDTSTSSEFVMAVLPEKCVISCGKNNAYGHPTAKTLGTIREVGAEICRTDRSGTIVLRGEKADD